MFFILFYLTFGSVNLKFLVMNLMKPVFYIASALALVGCGSALKTSSVATQKPVNQYVIEKIAGYPLLTEPTENLPKRTDSVDDEELKNWPHQDFATTGFPGISLDKAYQILEGLTPTKVIVGVIDSGIDINHEDLKDVIWVNKNEIPNNGIDDDKNGYIDDIHGWNFLGNINEENMEYVRILRDKDENFPKYQEAKSKYDEELFEATMDFVFYKKLHGDIETHKNTIEKELKNSEFTANEIIEKASKITSKSKELQEALKFFSAMRRKDVKITKILEDISEGKKHFQTKLDGHLNMKLNARKILGDNPYDITDTNYGDNNVIGPVLDGALHGTHVAGIIGAVRNNGLGGNGVTNELEIMAIRAVPDGDEYDKDIALAIRYAADNGAKVINTSFGKGYSPNPEWVREAIKYAASKDVLIVNAAGNDAKNIDKNITYPDDNIDGLEYTDNVLTIGALNYESGENILANFTNYGKRNVDIFAPGVKIYATAPDNSYKFLQGTSMASPEVAGIAALIRAYFPNLSAREVKEIIMESGIKLNLDKVKIGRGESVENFSDISKSGRIANVYNAVILAVQKSKSK